MRYCCVSKCVWYSRAETTCTHHKPASKMNSPATSTTATRRSCGSFFFSSSKTSMIIRSNVQGPKSNVKKSQRLARTMTLDIGL